MAALWLRAHAAARGPVRVQARSGGLRRERMPTGSGVQELGLASFASILVQHCKHAFGFVMTTQGGKKFVFSGDTQKCGNLIRAASGAMLLVHEATFEDHLRKDADYKKHSTISDAVDVRAPPPLCALAAHACRQAGRAVTPLPCAGRQGVGE